ncbi:hypothetical protein EYF80_038375 [Liparis tanakae]|uniref:Uncharacterized protein n=1 Tax=Liparis tanakae TaxID=230148 RepID=A0A4Z2GFH3_9TELE|nr:hypothetical protein EYF80_038375 [Liparis tanakae]
MGVAGLRGGKVLKRKGVLDRGRPWVPRTLQRRETSGGEKVPPLLLRSLLPLPGQAAVAPPPVS